ncbi:MAG: serine/threonine protein kinase, partial [Myxococcaceae bacterium]|nr:serine/threonine protein kinase [Myxococcaceae bacterium]
MEAHTCIGCNAAVDQPRCEHCGIAVAPGGWNIVRQIATGPHSRVFLAEKNGEQAALKELLFALVPDAALLEGFEREARLLAQLSHPAIPRLVESFTEGKGVHTRLYLAQQFVRGKSLLQQLEHHRFDEAEAKRLARSLLEILEYLHGLSPRVIHRDLKPANVMRREDGSLALVDFGAARDLVRGVTHGSTLVGTFGYMPPEQMGGTVDLTSDLYALGATLLHLLSRKPPDELLKPGLELAFDEAVNVSPPFRGWLQQLVERERSARFQTATAAREALDALDRTQPVAAARGRRRSPAWLYALGGVGIALAAGLVLLTVAPKATPEAVVSAPVPVAWPVTPVAPTPPSPQQRPRPPVTGGAITQGSVTTVAKAKPLPPFTLGAAFTAPLGTKIPLASGSCDPLGASLEVLQIRAAPG